MNKAAKKKRSRKGFTLAEVLMAILIMALATSVLAVGIRSASNAYNKVIDVANAQLLLTTTTNTLRSKLDTARTVQVTSDGTSITYINSDKKEVTIASTTSGITIDEYGSYSSARLLVSDAAASKKLYATFTGSSYENGILTIENLSVYRKGDASTAAPLAAIEEFEIKPIQ